MFRSFYEIWQLSNEAAYALRSCRLHPEIPLSLARLEVFGRASSFLHDASLNYRRQAPRVWRRIVEVWRVLAEKDGAPTDLEVRLKEFSNFLSLYHFDRSNAELALAVERFFRCLVPIAQERAWRESLRQRRVRSADTIWL